MFPIYSVHTCGYRRPYTAKHVYWYFLFCRNSGYGVFNGIRKWHPASVGYPACIRDPAFIEDAVSIRTSILACIRHTATI